MERSNDFRQLNLHEWLWKTFLSPYPFLISHRIVTVVPKTTT